MMLPLPKLFGFIFSTMIPPFIFFIIAINVVKAQENTNDSVSNFQPSLPVVIGMLAIMFSLTFVLLLYAKFCHRASTSTGATSHQIQDGLARSRGGISPLGGVEKSLVESLPYFRFSSLKGSREGLECSVCLARFEDVEVLRLLPKCKHAFHIDCIDLWLEKHATCPLCRQRVTAEDLSDVSLQDLFVERQESRHGSLRFSICSSFRNVDVDEDEDEDEDELPISKRVDHRHDRFNHKIVEFKSRWSDVTSSDLVFLNSEMLNHEEESTSTTIKEMNILAKSDSGCGSGSKALDPNEKRSMSEIVVHSRFEDSLVNVKEERMRRLWLPIATKTVQLFANRDTNTRTIQSQGLNLQTSNV